MLSALLLEAGFRVYALTTRTSQARCETEQVGLVWGLGLRFREEGGLNDHRGHALRMHASILRLSLVSHPRSP